MTKNLGWTREQRKCNEKIILVAWQEKKKVACYFLGSKCYLHIYSSLKHKVQSSTNNARKLNGARKLNLG